MNHHQAKKIAKSHGLELTRYRYGGGAYWYLWDEKTTEGHNIGLTLIGIDEDRLNSECKALLEEIKNN